MARNECCDSLQPTWRRVKRSLKRLPSHRVAASLCPRVSGVPRTDQILAESVERFTEKVGRDKDLFLAVLGHDLRNPLSAIKMGSALLLRSDTITARDHNSAVIISRSADRMGQMVHDLLDFTRTRLGARLPISVE